MSIIALIIFAGVGWFLYKAGVWVGAESIASELPNACEKSFGKEFAQPFSENCSRSKGSDVVPPEEKFHIYVMRIRSILFEFVDACQRSGMELQERMDAPREGAWRLDLNERLYLCLLILQMKASTVG